MFNEWDACTLSIASAGKMVLSSISLPSITGYSAFFYITEEDMLKVLNGST
jgi:hypothetical protein